MLQKRQNMSISEPLLTPNNMNTASNVALIWSALGQTVSQKLDKGISMLNLLKNQWVKTFSWYQRWPGLLDFVYSETPFSLAFSASFFFSSRRHTIKHPWWNYCILFPKQLSLSKRKEKIWQPKVLCAILVSDFFEW